MNSKTSNKQLLYFWGSWCPVCKQTEQMLDTLQLAIPVERINVDQHPVCAAQHKILGTPTFCLMQDTEEVGRLTGAVSPRCLQQFIMWGTL